MLVVHMVLKPCERPPKNHVQGLLNIPWFYYTWFRRAVQMVLKPCARPPKQPMVLLYVVYDGLANGFKTMGKAS